MHASQPPFAGHSCWVLLVIGNRSWQDVGLSVYFELVNFLTRTYHMYTYVRTYLLVSLDRTQQITHLLIVHLLIII